MLAAAALGLAGLVPAAVAAAAAPAPPSHLPPRAATNFTWAPNLGQHRAIITLPASRTPGAAAWATIPWQRRAVPNATTTAAVITVASTGTVVANAVRAPAGAGISDSEALTFVFMPTQADAGPVPPPPGPDPGGFVVNRGTAAKSIVTKCSGALAGCDCWKAADGKMLFNDAGGAEGWDARTEQEVSWLEMDLGSVPATPVTKFGVFSVSRADDPQWFPPRGETDTRGFRGLYT